MQNTFLLTEEDKLFWFSFIETKIGLILPTIQQRHFVAKIVEKMKLYQLSSDEYFKKVKESDLEWQNLINELTIPETSFFRHPSSYDLVKSFIESKGKSSVHLWSVGCSTGEEAWSLAMLANEHAKSFRVMATDVNEMSIAKAKNAVYSSRKLEILPTGYKEKYFTKVSQQSSIKDEYQINSFLKKHVSYYKHNLIEQKRIPFREVDVIFCQNVLIYFRNFVQRDILNQLVSSLAIDGLLIMAPAEARSWKNQNMERVNYPGTLAFKRIK